MDEIGGFDLLPKKPKVGSHIHLHALRFAAPGILEKFINIYTVYIIDR